MGDFKDLIKEMNKASGSSGSVVFHGPDWENKVGNVKSTGFIGLDSILGHGGFAGGRIMNLAGDESSGKTSLAMHMVAGDGDQVLWVNSEATFDKQYAANIGLNCHADFAITNGEATLEQVWPAIVTAVKQGVDWIVVDSFNALLTDAEKAAPPDKDTIGKKAKKWSELLPYLNALLMDHQKTRVIIIHQYRDNMSGFGSPFKISGGRAIKYFASYNLFITGLSPRLKSGDDIIGHTLNLTTYKNKVYPPRMSCEIPLLYDGFGVSPEWELMKLAADVKVIRRGGSNYKYQDQVLANGKLNFLQFLRDNPDLFKEIKDKTRNALGIPS